MEITTELVGMKVDINPENFPATIKRGKNAAGVNVISIEIKCEGMQIYQQAEAIAKEYEEVLESTAEAKGEEFNKLDARL